MSPRSLRATAAAEKRPLGPPRPDESPEPGSSTEQAVALDAIRRIVRVLRLSSRASELQVGLSGAQLFVLEQLARRPAESLNDLAERTLTHQSSVSVVVSRLVERGLVTRDASIQDNRRITIAITPAGRSVLRRAPERAAQARLVAGLRAMPPRELAALSRGLRTLARSVEDGDGAVPARARRPSV